MRRGAAGLGMAGDELHPAGVAPVGQRDLQLGRGAERGRDPRYDLHRNAGGTAGGKLLGGAAEHHGIAALEAHHTLAVARQTHHQAIDVVLPAGGTAAGLADQHAPRLAPRQLEDLRADQPVVEDDVGRLQGAERLEGEQLRIARPGADEGDRSAIAGPRKSQVSQVLLGRRRTGRECLVRKPTPKVAARRAHRQSCRDGRAQALRRRRPDAEGWVQQRLDLGADRLAQDRRGAIGADADHHRRAIDDAAEAEGRELGCVDDVDGDAVPASGRGECGRLLAGQGAVRQRGSGQVVCVPSPADNGDAAGRRRLRERIELGAWIGCKRLHVCAGSSGKLGLPDRRIAGPGQDDALARQIDEYRQHRQRMHAGGTGLAGWNLMHPLTPPPPARP